VKEHRYNSKVRGFSPTKILGKYIHNFLW